MLPNLRFYDLRWFAIMGKNALWRIGEPIWNSPLNNASLEVLVRIESLKILIADFFASLLSFLPKSENLILILLPSERIRYII